MGELTREQLIEMITKEVLKRMNQDSPASCNQRCPSVLVIGDVKKLPGDVMQMYNCCGMDSYEGDIQDFEKIYITELGMLELADIALGRNTRPVQCAVTNGLLYGKEIILYDFALAHRKFKETSSRNFYLLLDAYVNALTNFGVRLVSGHEEPLKSTGQEINPILTSGVVTEAKAKELVKQGSGDILLKKGTLLTPSAKDIFYSSGRSVHFV